MRIFREIEQIKGQIPNPVVCVGSFDGVHKGHQLLIDQMNARAREINGQSLIITFDPHPRDVLKGQNRLLTDIDKKLDLLQKAQVDNVLIINFTLQFSQIPYDTFVQKYLIEAIGAKVIFSGDGHSFGKDKKGNPNTLKQFGLEVHNIPRFQNISSTAIRDAIDNNNIELAQQMLGHKL